MSLLPAHSLHFLTQTLMNLIFAHALFIVCKQKLNALSIWADCSRWLCGILSHARSVLDLGLFRKISKEDMAQEFLPEEIFLEGNYMIAFSLCRRCGCLIIHPCFPGPHALPWVRPASVFTALETIQSGLDMQLPHPGFFSLPPLLPSICFAQMSSLNHFWSDSFNVNPRMERDLVQIPRLD